MSRRQPKVGFVSLGCPKALVDSERIITQLRAEGYQVAPDYDTADVVVVNTCGFIDSAVDESLDAIGEALEQNGKVIVTGCLGARPERILERHPKVLKVTGPHAYEDVVGAVHEHLPPKHDPFLDLVPPQGIRLTPRHYAYLKISEGCNNKCSFCIIPSMRGLLVSRPIDEVLREGEKLARAGVKEIAGDLAGHLGLRRGHPLPRGRVARRRSTKRAFSIWRAGWAELGIWIRMHYVYPYPHVDNVIPLMAERKVLPYLDIPFQHGSPTVLKRMRRPGQVEKTLDRIRAWRETCPDLTIRSTFIVGFPGETEAEFEELLAWLDEAQLDRVGAFKYSPVEGAAANDVAPHVRAGDPGRTPRALHAEVRRDQRRAARGQGGPEDARAGRCHRRQHGHRAQRGRCARDRRRGEDREGRETEGRRVRRRRDHGIRRSRSGSEGRSRELSRVAPQPLLLP